MASKNVYVEKPGSQNPGEAEALVAAMKKSGKLVQMGNQRRTWMKEAIAALHGGVIGETRFARGTYYNTRKEVGQLALPPSADLDWNMWQGPVTDDPKHEMKKFAHYDWHWLWHWGNGELGNNGIHSLDILRWGLKVEYPSSSSSAGVPPLEYTAAGAVGFGLDIDPNAGDGGGCVIAVTRRPGRRVRSTEDPLCCCPSPDPGRLAALGPDRAANGGWWAVCSVRHGQRYTRSGMTRAIVAADL